MASRPLLKVSPVSEDFVLPNEPWFDKTIYRIVYRLRTHHPSTSYVSTCTSVSAGWPRPSANEANAREQIWNQKAQQSSLIPGSQASAIVQELGAASLGRQTLARCWSLADATHDGMLSKHEFEIFHYLVQRALNDGILPPSKLPALSPFPPSPMQPKPTPQTQQEPKGFPNDPFGATDLFAERLGGPEHPQGQGQHHSHGHAFEQQNQSHSNEAFDAGFHGQQFSQRKSADVFYASPSQQSQAQPYASGFDAELNNSRSFIADKQVPAQAHDHARDIALDANTNQSSQIQYAYQHPYGDRNDQPQSAFASTLPDAFSNQKEQQLHPTQQEQHPFPGGAVGGFDAFGEPDQPAQRSPPKQQQMQQQSHQTQKVDGGSDAFDTFGPSFESHYPQQNQAQHQAERQESSDIFGAQFSSAGGAVHGNSNIKAQAQDAFGAQGSGASETFQPLSQQQHDLFSDTSAQGSGVWAGSNTTTPNQAQHQGEPQPFGTQHEQQQMQPKQSEASPFGADTFGTVAEQQTHHELGDTAFGNLSNMQTHGATQHTAHQHAQQQALQDGGGDMFSSFAPAEQSNGELQALEREKSDLTDRLHGALGGRNENELGKRKEQLREQVRSLKEQVERAEAHARELKELEEEEQTLQQRLEAAKTAEDRIASINSRIQSSGLSSSRERIFKEALTILHRLGELAGQATAPTESTSSGGALNI